MNRPAKVALFVGVVVVFSFLGSLLGGCTDGARDAKTFTLNCGQRVTGAERHIELSHEGIVEVAHETPSVETDGDGMTGFEDVYTFTALAPGDVYVAIYDWLPWADEPDEKGSVSRRAFLHVDDKLKITQIEALDFRKVELVLSGTMAQARFYIAETESGMVRMNAYEARFGEEPPTRGELYDCYPQIAMLLARCNARRWNGYAGSNPYVLDGDGFNLTITLANGEEIIAHGTNAVPDGFRTFERDYVGLF